MKAVLGLGLRITNEIKDVSHRSRYKAITSAIKNKERFKCIVGQGGEIICTCSIITVLRADFRCFLGR